MGLVLSARQKRELKEWNQKVIDGDIRAEDVPQEVRDWIIGSCGCIGKKSIRVSKKDKVVKPKEITNDASS